MGTAWKHWLFQSHRPPEISYFPVSDHLRTHQGQSPQSLGTPRTAGRCNRAGGGLPTAVLYPSTKIERLQRAQNWGPRRRSFSEFGWSGQSPPHTRPNAVQVPRRVTAHLHSETGTQGPHGRDSGSLLPARLVLEHAGSAAQSGCGPRPQMRQAAACGKPGALLAPPNGG